MEFAVREKLTKLALEETQREVKELRDAMAKRREQDAEKEREVEALREEEEERER
jgi:hypothetical protein